METLARVGESPLIDTPSKTACAWGKGSSPRDNRNQQRKGVPGDKTAGAIHSTWAGDGEEKRCCVETLLETQQSLLEIGDSTARPPLYQSPSSFLCSFLFSVMCGFIPDVYFDVPILPHLTLVNDSVWSSCYVRVVKPSVNK